MHYSAPYHPLIAAFLLQKVEFRDTKKVIVENREQGEKLLKVLEELCPIQNTKYKIQNGNLDSTSRSLGSISDGFPPTREGQNLAGMTDSTQIIINDKQSTINYKLILTHVDVLEVEETPGMVGIFTCETLDWKVLESEKEQYRVVLEKNGKYNEEKLITWLSEHGYVAKKSDEVGTYFRIGDTITIPLQQGILRVSFLGTTIEDLFLDDMSIAEVRVYGMK